MAVIERHSTGWRRTGLVVAVVASMATAGALVNTSLHAYPTVGDLTGTPRFPDVEQLHPTSNLELERGATARISVPDTASHFGVFDAQVYLPPQYFSEPQRRFPVVILTHGNPGRSTDWLDEGSAAQTGLTVAQSGHPVILVMPTVLQEPYGDSLCVDTALEGNAETYVVKDVVAAADAQLRTMPGAAHRAIGGFSMGGFCALNLGLKHPDVFSVVLAFSALTVCEPDAIEGGNETLFGTSGLAAAGRGQQPRGLLALARPGHLARDVAGRRRGRVRGGAAPAGVRRGALHRPGSRWSSTRGRAATTSAPGPRPSRSRLPWAAARLGA